jgi:hypothetical protein
LNTALIVAAIALSVLAVAQLVLLLILWRIVSLVAQTLREVGAAADEIGRAAREVGALAGTTRSTAQGLLGALAIGRWLPRAGNGGAVKIGLDLASALFRALRHRRGGGGDKGAAA